MGSEQLSTSHCHSSEHNSVLPACFRDIDGKTFAGDYVLKKEKT